MARNQTTRSLLWQILVPAARWPLYSPRRVGVIAVVAVGLFWVIVATHHSDPAGPAGSPSAGASASTGAPAPNGAAPSTTAKPSAGGATATGQPWSDSSALAPATASGNPIDQARRFAQAWARPSVPARTWLAGVSPYVTSTYRDELTSTTPSQISTTQVGSPLLVSQTRTSRVVHFRTSPGPRAGVNVTLVPADGQWRVSRITPA